MIRSLLGLGATLALFGSAQAQTLGAFSETPASTTVQLAGRDGPAIKAELRHAAVRVCDAARQPFTAGLYDDETTATCVSNTYARALSAARRMAPQAFMVQTVAAR